MLLFLVLLNVVEANGEDFDDYLKKDCQPIVLLIFVFSFHNNNELLVSYLNANLFASRLLSQPSSRQTLLVCAADKDTAFAVLGFRTAMKSYS